MFGLIKKLFGREKKVEPSQKPVQDYSTIYKTDAFEKRERRERILNRAKELAERKSVKVYIPRTEIPSFTEENLYAFSGVRRSVFGPKAFIPIIIPKYEIEDAEIPSKELEVEYDPRGYAIEVPKEDLEVELTEKDIEVVPIMEVPLEDIEVEFDPRRERLEKIIEQEETDYELEFVKYVKKMLPTLIKSYETDQRRYTTEIDGLRDLIKSYKKVRNNKEPSIDKYPRIIMQGYDIRDEKTLNIIGEIVKHIQKGYDVESATTALRRSGATYVSPVSITPEFIAEETDLFEDSEEPAEITPFYNPKIDSDRHERIGTETITR